MNLETGRRLQEASSHGISVVAKATLKEEDTAAYSGSLLALCAEKDRGGGVSLACKGVASRTFAIYTTAILPRLWRDIILHERGSDLYVTRLNILAEKVSMLLPIYTAFDDLADTSNGTRSPHLESLPASPILETGQFSRNSLAESKPSFLLNAALHKQHCIIGQGSMTETLLVALRRPWCVLEICVGSTQEEYGNSGQKAAEFLKDILSFARLAYEKDESGYVMAVFLLEHELDKRHAVKTSHPMISTLQRHGRGQFETREASTWNCQFDTTQSSQPHRWPRTSYAYASCNKAVFLPSLTSFNAFWIRLICVSAVEAELSFSALVGMLAASIPGQIGLSDSRISRTTVFSQRGKQARRQSDSEVHLSRIFNDSVQCQSIDKLVRDMLQLYRGVVQIAEDYI
ncbi:uncharacterized protein TRUGW13939_00183 [Talaromyces rugulosus]|uniref:Uncharacterized protein n=1 Tax=Talaromyces rugulosus TaxID=121627 RepID=A0A7H8QHX4_TALRU|nr:uncharacterized protein TRUGW13939_00183 [Talaromyces rugulosus]QKX53111.1 hypothetical protein TRUGW13939_00183 [Talaromyces rugulosus]